MYKRIAMLALLAVAGATQGHPIVLEESARFTSPDPGFEHFARQVAVDGDHALVLAEHFDRSGEVITSRRRAIMWFERNAAGAWLYRRTLIDVDAAGTSVAPALALRDGVAAVITNRLDVFEYNGTDFVSAPVATRDTVNGPYLAVDAGRILASAPRARCAWDGALFQKVNGTWTITQNLLGPVFGCAGNMPGSGVALWNRQAVLTWPSAPGQDQPVVAMYAGIGTTPGTFGPSDEFTPWFYTPFWGPAVAISNAGPYVAADRNPGIYNFALGAEGYVGGSSFRALNGLMGTRTHNVRVTGGYVFQHTWSYDRGAWVIHVYPENPWNAPGTATLVGRSGEVLGTHFDVSGRRVLVSGNNGYTGNETAHVFDLPATFAASNLEQDNFESGTASSWQTLPGGMFSVAQEPRTKVFRQSNTTTETGALFGDTARTDQSIQADTWRRTAGGADRWQGLVTRHVDDGNYYYAVLRSNGRLELRRALDGTHSLLAGTAFTNGNARSYRLQLVSTRNLHQVFVDGRKLLQAYDSNLTSGRPGIRMARTAADFDNVVVTDREHATLYRTNFSTGLATPWGPADAQYPAGWELGTVRPGQISQRVLDASAEQLLAVPVRTDHQVVSARITLDGFGTPAPGEQSWVGLVARYGGIGYYALVLLPDNLMQLRLVTFSYSSGPLRRTTRVLKTATHTLPTGQREYRLEVIGSQIRAFVDDKPVIEATDSRIPQGSAGVATFAARASFDDLQVYQP